MQKRIWIRELVALSAWLVPLLIFVLSPSLWIKSGSPVHISGRVLGHAIAVVSSSPGTIAPLAALGAPSFPICIRCSALLGLGPIVLDLGTEALSSRARSLIVYGLDQNYRGYYESGGYRVSLSADLVRWQFVGIGSGISQWPSTSWNEIPFRYVLLEGSDESGRERAHIDAIEIRDQDAR